MSTVDAPVTSEMLERAAQDDAAFHALQRRFERLVWYSSYGFGFDRATREDVAQLVWLRLFEHLTRIRQPETLGTWLVTTTRHECQKLARLRTRTVLVEGYDPAAITTSHELDTNVIRDETVRLVATALNALSTRCQQLLRLLTLDPPATYEQIADVFDVKIGSIGSMRQRCLDDLANRSEIVSIIGTPTRSRHRGNR